MLVHIPEVEFWNRQKRKKGIEVLCFGICDCPLGISLFPTGLRNRKNMAIIQNTYSMGSGNCTSRDVNVVHSSY